MNDNITAEMKANASVKIRKDSVLLSGDDCFYTLQGEGPTMGLPCVFVRLHVCNLRCDWCDAFYTWKADAEEFWTEGHYLSFEDLAARIQKTWDDATSTTAHQRRVIFTGGEPLIQRKQIDEVVKILNRDTVSWTDVDANQDENGWQVEFETNGTLMPTKAQLYYGQFNCSPKLANSDNREGAMIKPKVLAALNEANTSFKFVCYDEKDLEEIEEKYLPHIDASKVIIMPQGIRSDEIDLNLQKLYEPCMARGYRLLGRMQSQFADGARRGV